MALPRKAGPPRVRRKIRSESGGFAEGRVSRPEHYNKPGPPQGRGPVGNHAENEFNNRCDEMAVAESMKFKE